MEFAIRAVGDKSVVSAGERNDPFLRDVTKARTIFSSLERLEGRTLTAKEVRQWQQYPTAPRELTAAPTDPLRVSRDPGSGPTMVRTMVRGAL